MREAAGHATLSTGHRRPGPRPFLHRVPDADQATATSRSWPSPDASADLRAQAAGIWPGVPLFENHEKLMDDVKPDGVWAFVDNHRHLEITKACAERGISVMFEKPMATSYADAVAIRDVAKARGIQVVINSQPPWWPANHTASQLARSGELGTVWRVHTVSGHGGPGGSPGAPTPTAPAAGATPRRPRHRRPRAPPAVRLLVDAEQRGAWRWRAARLRTVRRRVGALVPGDAVHGLRDQDPDQARRLPGAHDHDDPRVLSRSSLGIIEASWDLPRNIQQLEVFGDRGSVDLVSNSGSQLIRFETWQGRERREVPLAVARAALGRPGHVLRLCRQARSGGRVRREPRSTRT